MKNRVLVGLLLFLGAMCIFAFRIFVTPFVIDALILAISLGGTFEIFKMFKHKNKPSNLIISLSFCVLTYAIVLISLILKDSIFISLLLVLVALVVLSAIAFILETFKIGEEMYKKLGFNTFLNCIYPSFLFMPIYYINHICEFSTKAAGHDLVAVFMVMLVFLVSIFTDTFAFFIGRKLKGPKLAPKISPNKTISGAVGGLLGGVVAGILLFVIFNYAINLEAVFKTCSINFITIPILSILHSVFSQMGDLFASFLKRKHEIKDYSNIFAEQGGIMDRFDGESFTGSILLIFVLIFII